MLAFFGTLPVLISATKWSGVNSRILHSTTSKEGLFPSREFLKTRNSGQANRVFEIGETVRKVVMEAKSIDAARGNPSRDAAYSLREISAMAVRERLEEQWVGLRQSRNGGRKVILPRTVASLAIHYMHYDPARFH